MFEFFRFLIRPDMKPERIELEGGGTVFFLSIVIGSFEDALQVLAFAAWGIANQPDWKVASFAYEDHVLKVRIEQIRTQEPPEDDPPGDEEPPEDERQPKS